MVLKKDLLTLVSFITYTGILFSQNYSDEDFCIKVLNNLISQSPSAKQLEYNIKNAELSYLQEKLSWLPVLQLNLPQNAVFMRGDYIYMQNENSHSEKQIIITPEAELSISQKLPAGGMLMMNLSYGFQTVLERNVFLQNPTVSTSFVQPLAKGAFSIGKNPENQLLKNRFEYVKLQYQKVQIEIISRFLNVLQNLDCINADENYYRSLVSELSSKYDELFERHLNGEKTNMEFFKAHQNLIYAKEQLYSVMQQKEKYSTELEILFKDFSIADIEIFKNGLFSALENKAQKELPIQTNLDEKLLKNEIEQEQLSFQLDKINYVPQFYMNFSTAPDSNFYYEYSDWYKSWRSMIENPIPVKLTANVGLKMTFDFFPATAIRRKKYDAAMNAKQIELRTLQMTNEEMRKMYEKELEIQKNHFDSIKLEISREEEFRKERMTLFESGLITEQEFLESETAYFDIRRNFTRSFWEIIQKQIELIKN